MLGHEHLPVAIDQDFDALCFAAFAFWTWAENLRPFAQIPQPFLLARDRAAQAFGLGLRGGRGLMLRVCVAVSVFFRRRGFRGRVGVRLLGRLLCGALGLLLGLLLLERGEVLFLTSQLLLLVLALRVLPHGQHVGLEPHAVRTLEEGVLVLLGLICVLLVLGGGRGDRALGGAGPRPLVAGRDFGHPGRIRSGCCLSSRGARFGWLGRQLRQLVLLGGQGQQHIESRRRRVRRRRQRRIAHHMLG